MRLEEAYLSVSLRSSKSRTQSSDHRHEVSGPVRHYISGVVVQGDPELGPGGWKAKTCRHDPNHFTGNALHFDEPTDNRRITPKSPLPEWVAEDYQTVFPGRIFAPRKYSPQFRTHAQ